MIQFKSIDYAAQALLQAKQRQAAILLQLEPADTTEDIIEHLTDYIYQLKARRIVLGKPQADILGSLLGQQYVKEYGWQWMFVQPHPDHVEQQKLCVVSPDHELLIDPVWWVESVANTSRATNFLLNFHMVKYDNMPVMEKAG